MLLTLLCSISAIIVFYNFFIKVSLCKPIDWFFSEMGRMSIVIYLTPLVMFPKGFIFDGLTVTTENLIIVLVAIIQCLLAYSIGKFIYKIPYLRLIMYGKNKILISVVIPLYNKEKTIVHTLSTVISQTYKFFEVIIVNDGSSDNSVQLINDNFSDSKIRIISQPNAGVSTARNRGIEEAKGDWIAFLDADDEWLPTYLESVVNAILANREAQVVLSGRFAQNFLTHDRSTNIPSRYKGGVVTIDFFENPHVFMHISATVIKKECLFPSEKWNRFIEGQKYNEDFTFLFRVIMHCQCVVYIAKPISIYNGNVEGQATSSIAVDKRLNDGILFRNKVWEEYPSMKKGLNKKKFKLFMRYELRHCILNYLKHKDYEALIFLLMA